MAKFWGKKADYVMHSAKVSPAVGLCVVNDAPVPSDQLQGLHNCFSVNL